MQQPIYQQQLPPEKVKLTNATEVPPAPTNCTHGTVDEHATLLHAPQSIWRLSGSRKSQSPSTRPRQLAFRTMCATCPPATALMALTATPHRPGKKNAEAGSTRSHRPTQRIQSNNRLKASLWKGSMAHKPSSCTTGSVGQLDNFTALATMESDVTQLVQNGSRDGSNGRYCLASSWLTAVLKARVQRARQNHCTYLCWHPGQLTTNC